MAKNDFTIECVKQSINARKELIEKLKNQNNRNNQKIARHQSIIDKLYNELQKYK